MREQRSTMGTWSSSAEDDNRFPISVTITMCPSPRMALNRFWYCSGVRQIKESNRERHE